jgi:hypothetical protein
MRQEITVDGFRQFTPLECPRDFTAAIAADASTGSG